jgi:hypothetical protein
MYPASVSFLELRELYYTPSMQATENLFLYTFRIFQVNRSAAAGSSHSLLRAPEIHASTLFTVAPYFSAMFFELHPRLFRRMASSPRRVMPACRFTHWRLKMPSRELAPLFARGIFVLVCTFFMYYR